MNRVRRLVLILLCCAATIGAAQQPRTSARAEAWIASGAKHEEAGRFDEAARDYKAAITEAERVGDRKHVAEGLTALGYILYFRGEMNDALVELRRGYETYNAIGDVQGRRGALNNIAHVYADVRVAQYDRAIEYYRQLLAEYEAAAGGAIDVADTLFNLGSTYSQKGDTDAALEWFRRALAAEERLGRPEEIASVKRAMGMVYGKTGRYAEALPLFDDALRVFVQKGDENGAMQVRQSRGIVLRKMGRLGAAIDDLETTAAYFAKSNNARFLEKSKDELALAYADARRWADAYRARTEHEAVERQLAVKLRDDHTARLRIQFDSEKKDQENRVLLREKAANERIRRLQTIILFLGSVIIAVLAYLAVRLRTIAMTDELTRLPNRRRTLALAAHQLQRGSFALFAIDIDHFKAINDTYGHAAGDVVLQRVANACRINVAPNGIVGRIGGEEFLVLLPNTPLPAARTIAEHLRTNVESIDLSDIAPALRVTISIGLIETAAHESLSTVTRRADELLYRAKELGRNRVEMPAV